LEIVGYNTPVNRNCLEIRLYPDRAQARELEATLETCRLVYNSLVNDRKFQNDTAKVSMGYFTQKVYLPDHRVPETRQGQDAPQVVRRS